MVIAQPFTSGLTMRAADDGWAAHFWSVFAASGFSRFDRESNLQPIAANVSRWAVVINTAEKIEGMHLVHRKTKGV